MHPFFIDYNSQFYVLILIAATISKCDHRIGIGYIYPGKPLANVTFKTYGSVSMGQALSFVNDFKLGHYMKIPSRSMFVVQVSELIPIKLI